MSFVAPLWLAVAAMAAAGVIAAHLFSTNVPPMQVMPTVRFIPQGAPMPVLRTRRISDVALLLLRLLAVALLGLALAGAHVPRTGPSRVVVVDASRAVPAVGTGRASEDAGAIYVAFDSAARVVNGAVLDTLSPFHARGSLSAGIVAAHRAIAHVTAGRRDIELVIVSPVVREEVDSATARLIALWDGPVRITRVPGAQPPLPASFQIRALGDDPVVASLATSHPPGPVGVRIVRTAVTSADSIWAREGRVVVAWPALATSAGEAGEAVNGFASGSHTIVGNFTRTRAPANGRVIARWIDGAPAATEIPLSAGCIRDVAISVDPLGDLALRDSFRGFVRSLLEPCGGARDFTVVPDSAILPRVRHAAAGVAPGTPSRLPLLFAFLALLALLTEQLVRRQRRTT